MKCLVFALIAIIAIMIFLFAFPKSCNKFGNSELLERKSERSLIIDSIKRVETEKHNKVYDSLILVHEKNDSISKLKTEILTKDYKRLRAIVRHLTSIRVDSLNQIVNGVPIEQYNALIESGNKCDSLLTFKNEQLSIKDSIIILKDKIIQGGKELNATTTQALNDYIELAESEKKDKEKAQKLSRKIILIAVTTAVIEIVFTILR